MSLRLKRFVSALAIVLVAGLAVGGYYVYAITRDIDMEWEEAPNTVDAQEAKRKLKLFLEAQKVARHGFIRLSEVELNSYLEQNYSAGSASARTNAPARERMLKSGVSLSGKQVVFWSWVRKRVWGVPMNFVWQRTATLQRAQNGWAFAVQAMRVGKLEMNPRLWPYVNQFLGATDQVFAKQFDWLVHLPGLEIVENELSHRPELKLYNYSPKEPGHPTTH